MLLCFLIPQPTQYIERTSFYKGCGCMIWWSHRNQMHGRPCRTLQARTDTTKHPVRNIRSMFSHHASHESRYCRSLNKYHYHGPIFGYARISYTSAIPQTDIVNKIYHNGLSIYLSIYPSIYLSIYMHSADVHMHTLCVGFSEDGHQLSLLGVQASRLLVAFLWNQHDNFCLLYSASTRPPGKGTG